MSRTLSVPRKPKVAATGTEPAMYRFAAVPPSTVSRVEPPVLRSPPPCKTATSSLYSSPSSSSPSTPTSGVGADDAYENDFISGLPLYLAPYIIDKDPDKDRLHANVAAPKQSALEQPRRRVTPGRASRFTEVESFILTNKLRPSSGVSSNSSSLWSALRMGRRGSSRDVPPTPSVVPEPPRSKPVPCSAVSDNKPQVLDEPVCAVAEAHEEDHELGVFALDDKPFRTISVVIPEQALFDHDFFACFPSYSA
ncbi:hypothetical protein AAL_03057 [Moelleriella libera RCEF 2490]|uniref:Uncharacterized protein n=1 Tax=Moelleriella libera RCEF 2490 TaxID=1081109 RepID=A0A168E8S3_9HYPO|nr:hypothetical protein AAL_03057 [Moelleriella libera RCEF 2490]